MLAWLQGHLWGLTSGVSLSLCVSGIVLVGGAAGFGVASASGCKLSKILLTIALKCGRLTRGICEIAIWHHSASRNRRGACNVSLQKVGA